MDGDGYGSPTSGAGCPALLDCHDDNAAVSPGRLETQTTAFDDNCNGRSAMLVGFTESAFAAGAWSDTGLVSHGADGVLVGTSSATKRVGINRNLNTGTVVAVRVTSTAGGACNFRIRTSVPGVPGATWYTKPLPATGVNMLDFTGDFSPPRVLKEAEISCPAGRSVNVDWLSVQDAELEFAPPADISVTWKDTRLPAGAHSVSIVRDDHNGVLYFGDDVGGISRFMGSGWEIANGEGTQSLVMGGTVGVTDLLPMEDGSGEVYALMGDMNAGQAGGLWRTTDSGDSWEMLASAQKQMPGQAWAAATTADDVMGDPRTGHCGSAASYQIGGSLLQAHSTAPLLDNTIYIANADPDNLGVSIWDGTESCAMPHTGDALPQDLVGSLLVVDTLPGGTPALVVGYRGRVGGAPSLYVCELPSSGAVCGGASAACQEVTLGDGAPDVRDLELNTWRRDVLEETTETGVLVVDSGGRPLVDGGECEYTAGTVGELLITDTGSGLSVSVVEDIVTGAELADVAAGWALTGVSFDGDSEYLFANTPVGPGSKYAWDRAYRVLADELFAGTPVFEPLNSEATGAAESTYAQEDWYEKGRRLGDLDLAGAWLESELEGKANVFPARSAPGAMPDFEWLDSYELAGGVEIAVGINGNHAWWMIGLDEPWGDDELYESIFDPTDTVANAEANVLFNFWPDINTSTQRTPQGTSTKDVTIGWDGHIWGAHGDLGISHTDTTVVATSSDPVGAEVDCLWGGWRASAQSIHAVRFRGEGEGPDPVIWATIRDQGSKGPDHQAGVVRSLDNGATWEYAGAGFLHAPLKPAHSVTALAEDPAGGEYGYRACLDEHNSHVATPFLDLDTLDLYWPAHAFSAGTTLAEAQLVTTSTIGVPRHIRALDESLALVWMGPDEDVNETPDAIGGILLTVNGGSTWNFLDFDGGPAGCDEATVYAGGEFDLRPTPVDESLAAWDGSDGALEFFVYGRDGAANKDCAMARVIVDDLGTTPVVSWDWLELPKVDTGSWGATGSCGVTHENLQAAALSPWSAEVMLVGNYTRDWGGSTTTFTNVYGGACLYNIDTNVFTMVSDPRTSTRSFAAAAAHPNVADLWVLTPELDVASYQQCNDVRAYAGSFATACEEPIPQLVKGTTGAAVLMPVNDRPPHLMGTSVVWSELGVDDDSADGQGSYIVVGIDGGGVWRGELTW